jgi:hypothetical protein
MLFPPVPSNNGHYNGVLEILQNIEKILQCKVHNIPPNHMQQACLEGHRAWGKAYGARGHKAQGARHKAIWVIKLRVSGQ